MEKVNLGFNKGFPVHMLGHHAGCYNELRSSDGKLEQSHLFIKSLLYNEPLYFGLDLWRVDTYYLPY